MAKIYLVTGGARSGKSQFAESICISSQKKIGYIATSEIHDDEMKRRVEMHQDRRPREWKTWESPSGAIEVLKEAQENSEILLFDCLTLYLTYWMFSPETPQNPKEKEKFVLLKIDDLLKSFKSWEGTIIFVTNEVGLGIVPENSVAREFRDLAGLMNEKVAKAANEVYWVVCGQAIPLKKLAVLPEEVL